MIQRFSSSLAVNVHFHSVFFDGVYTVREDGAVRFVPVPAPTDEEVVALTRKVGRSIRRASSARASSGMTSIPRRTRSQWRSLLLRRCMEHR